MDWLSWYLFRLRCLVYVFNGSPSARHVNTFPKITAMLDVTDDRPTRCETSFRLFVSHQLMSDSRVVSMLRLPREQLRLKFTNQTLVPLVSRSLIGHQSFEQQLTVDATWGLLVNKSEVCWLAAYVLL